MNGSRWLATALVAIALAAVGCGSADSTVRHATPTKSPPPPPPSSITKEPAPVLMPDLIGLPSRVASQRIGRLEMRNRLGIGSHWQEPIPVGCGLRPDTVMRQRPRGGAPLERGTEIQIRTAALNLDRFRGPCEPADGDLGPVTGADAALAREFYRFAADPSLGGPFAAVDIWVGIEDWPNALSLDPTDLTDLSAWEMHTAYAERSWPLSALDPVAASGGYYEVHEGVRAWCFTSRDTPEAMAGTRAITLTAPSDTVSACMEWWGVTLFLDEDNLIHGVSLRFGSP